MTNRTLFLYLSFSFALLVCSLHSDALNKKWAKQYGIADRSYGEKITKDKAGNIYLLGTYSSSFIAFNQDTLLSNSFTPPYYMKFVTKMNDTGGVLWSWNVPSQIQPMPQNLAVDTMGNIYISGLFFDDFIVIGNDTLINAGPGTGTAEVVLLKLDSLGNLLWVRCGHGEATDWMYQSITDKAGNTYMVGDFFSKTLTFDSTVLTNNSPTDTVTDIFIVKYNTNGKLVWAKRAGSSGYEGAASLAFDLKGNIVVAGNINSSTVNFGPLVLTNTGTTTPFLLKMDTAGNYIWVKSAGPENVLEENCITIASSGAIYAVGIFYQNSFMMGSDLMTAYGGLYDVFTAKYDSSANLLWARSSGGTGDDSPTGILTDAFENVYIFGYYSSPIMYTDEYNIYNNGTTNVFVIKYDSAANNLMAQGIGGDAIDYTFSGIISGNNNLYITGTMTSSQVVINQDTLHLNGKSDAFLTMFVHDTAMATPQLKMLVVDAIQLYPNPGSGKYHLCTYLPLNEHALKIINSAGCGVSYELKKLTNSAAGIYDYQIEVGGMPGIYFLDIEQNGVQHTLRFVKTDE